LFWNQRPGSLGPDGRNPEIVKVAETSEILNTLQKLLNLLIHEQNVVPENIIVLSPLNVNNSVLKEGQRIGHLILSWHESGEHKIRCSTIHAFKGLESPVIILVEMSNAHADTRNELMYVALSRARNHLIIVIQEDDDFLKVINDT
jgi:superfamily I DNA/RNA helicase